MWLALVRLFIVDFKGQVAVSNYSPRREAAPLAWTQVEQLFYWKTNNILLASVIAYFSVP